MDIGWWSAAAGIAAAVCGVFATLSTLRGSSVRSLRSGLKADGELLEKMQGRARGDLSVDVKRRQYLLIAALRFPSLIWHELLLIGGISLIAAVLYGLASEIPGMAEDEMLGPESLGPGQALLVLLCFMLYVPLVRSWGVRAAARVEYIGDRIGVDEAGMLLDLLKFPAFGGAYVFAGTLSVGALLNIISLWGVAGWHISGGILLSTGLTMVFFGFTYLAARQTNLLSYLTSPKSLLPGGTAASTFNGPNPAAHPSERKTQDTESTRSRLRTDVAGS